MRTVFFAAAAAAVLSLNAATASATDIVNQDEVAHTVTLTSVDGVHEMEVAAASEATDVCKGCAISVNGAEPVEAGADDVVAIIGGVASVQE